MGIEISAVCGLQHVSGLSQSLLNPSGFDFKVTHRCQAIKQWQLNSSMDRSAIDNIHLTRCDLIDSINYKN